MDSILYIYFKAKKKAKMSNLFMESVKTKVKSGKANLSNKANNNYKNWRIKRRCFMMRHSA